MHIRFFSMDAADTWVCKTTIQLYIESTQLSTVASHENNASNHPQSLQTVILSQDTGPAVATHTNSMDASNPLNLEPILVDTSKFTHTAGSQIKIMTKMSGTDFSV